jgi:hypothetical protein
VAGLDVWLFCKSRGLLTEGNKSKQMHQYATSSPTTVFWFVLTQKSASQRSLGINKIVISRFAQWVCSRALAWWSISREFPHHSLLNSRVLFLSSLHAGNF